MGKHVEIAENGEIETDWLKWPNFTIFQYPNLKFLSEIIFYILIFEKDNT